MNRVEILSQGDEVITGQTIDSNAAWLSQQLVDMGFDIVHRTTVGDRLEDIKEALHQAKQRCDLLVCTGGLGPTDDDLTAEAVSAVSDLPLVYDDDAMELMKAMFQRLNRKMVKSNEKQAWLPKGAKRIDNHWGTAPGFALTIGNTQMAFLPGVPGEMKAMFEHGLKPELQKFFDLRPSRLVIFRTTGAGESNLQERIGNFEHDEVALSYRAMGREVQIKLRFANSCSSEVIDKLCKQMKVALAENLFAIDGWGLGFCGNLAEVVMHLLNERKLSLGVAESSSAGELTRLLRNNDVDRRPSKGLFYSDEHDLFALLNIKKRSKYSTDYYYLGNMLKEQLGTDIVLITSPFEGVDNQSDINQAQRADCYLVSSEGCYSFSDQVAGSVEYRCQAIAYSALNLLRKTLLEEHF